MKIILNATLGLLPAGRLKNRLLNLAGHSIHKSARIHPILILGRTRLVISEGVHIGLLNVLRNVVQLELSEHCVIGQFNWFSCDPGLVASSPHLTAGTMTMLPFSDITSKHLIDVAGGVTLGTHSIIGGARSTLISHGLDVEANVVRTDPITIGQYTMLGACVQVILGANIPAYSVVAMGALVTRGLTTERMIYGGAPARPLRELNDAKFWLPELHHKPGLE